MAQARIETQVIKQPQRVRRVCLMLTEGEADYLLAVTARTRGSAKDSPVKYARRIHAALTRAVGYDYQATDASHLISGFLKFTTYDKLKDRRKLRIKRLRDEANANFSNLFAAGGPVGTGRVG